MIYFKALGTFCQLYAFTDTRFPSLYNFISLRSFCKNDKKSCFQMFYKIGIPKIFAIFIGKHLC